MKKIFKNPFLIVLILAVLAIYALMTETSNSAELKIIGLKADARESVKRYDSLEAIQSIEKERWHKDSVSMALSNQKLTRDNARLQLRVTLTRSVKQVQQAIDSIPEVATAFNADDSLALGLKEQVDTLTNQLIRQADHYKAQLHISEEKNAELKGQLATKEGIIEEQDKELKRRKRIGKLTTIGIGVAFIVGLAIGL